MGVPGFQGTDGVPVSKPDTQTYSCTYHIFLVSKSGGCVLGGGYGVPKITLNRTVMGIQSFKTHELFCILRQRRNPPSVHVLE